VLRSPIFHTIAIVAIVLALIAFIFWGTFRGVPPAASTGTSSTGH
jgi:hypothetical protein